MKHMFTYIFTWFVKAPFEMMSTLYDRNDPVYIAAIMVVIIQYINDPLDVPFYYGTYIYLNPL